MLLTQTHVFGGIDNLSRLPRAYIVERLCATNGRYPEVQFATAMNRSWPARDAEERRDLTSSHVAT